jgi:hypothetical protein
MSIVTLEGVVEHGQIRLTNDVQLPDHTKVYIIVPSVVVEQTAHTSSPRLVRPEQVADFTLEIIEDTSDAGI